MNNNEGITNKSAWSIIIVVYLAIATGVAFIISQELDTNFGLLALLILAIFAIIGTVPNIEVNEIPQRKILTFVIVIANEFIFYLIAFVLSIFSVSFITNKSFTFVFLTLLFTIILIFGEIWIFYKIKPTYRNLRNYVNQNINFVNLFTFLSIVGTLLSSDFSLISVLNNNNETDIDVLKTIFTISSTAFLGYWLINNIINNFRQ